MLNSLLAVLQEYFLAGNSHRRSSSDGLRGTVDPYQSEIRREGRGSSIEVIAVIKVSSAGQITSSWFMAVMRIERE